MNNTMITLNEIKDERTVGGLGMHTHDVEYHICTIQSRYSLLSTVTVGSSLDTSLCFWRLPTDPNSSLIL
jgi:hypothetical protein